MNENFLRNSRINYEMLLGRSILLSALTFSPYGSSKEEGSEEGCKEGRQEGGKEGSPEEEGRRKEEEGIVHLPSTK